jgi:putative OPT family oligopeptide transporter
MQVVVVGFFAIVVALAIAPGVLGGGAGFGFRIVGAISIAVFSFFFATVASRIVGMLGTTSNPVSGMTIVTMLGTTGVLLVLGHSGLPGQLLAITIGTVVCTAASIAGDMSQDLKTGYLVGATPRRQQIAQLICVVASAPFIAGTVLLLAAQGGIGTQEIPAPQATLLKTVVEGVLSRDLPWTLVLTGAALALVASALHVPALAFAVGIYLPLATMSTIFVGGCVRALADRRLGARAEGGVLVGSGLVAGESILGVAIAGYAFRHGKPRGLGLPLPPWAELAIGSVAVVLLLGMVYRSAARGDSAEPPTGRAQSPASP